MDPFEHKKIGTKSSMRQSGMDPSKLQKMDLEHAMDCLDNARAVIAVGLKSRPVRWRIFPDW
jgi:hypothetical protein